MEINELHQLAQIAVKYDDIGDFNNAIIYYSVYFFKFILKNIFRKQQIKYLN